MLHGNAGTMRCAVEMAPQYAAGLNLNNPERVLPVRTAAPGSPRDVPREVPDPRARNRKFTRSSLLLWIAMGLLAGRKIRNHGTPDVQWEEDKTRSGNRAPNATPAILRVALIPVEHRQAVTLSWPRTFEQCAHSTTSPGEWGPTNSHWRHLTLLGHPFEEDLRNELRRLGIPHGPSIQELLVAAGIIGTAGQVILPPTGTLTASLPSADLERIHERIPKELRANSMPGCG